MDIARYYHILGISPLSSDKELRTAYKNLAMVLHPDKQPLPTTTEQGMNFLKVQEAYEKVVEERKRLSRINLTNQIFKQSFANLLAGSSQEDEEQEFMMSQRNKTMEQKLSSIKSILQRWKKPGNQKGKQSQTFSYSQTQSSQYSSQTVTKNYMKLNQTVVSQQQITYRVKNRIKIFKIVTEEEL